MKPWVLSLVIIAVAVFCAASVLFGPGDPGEEESPESVEYGIQYIIDGGVLPDGYPESYKSGVYTDLPTPARDGKRFAGWFSDPGLTVPVGAIRPSDSGDMVLHAKWIDPVPGLKQVMTVSSSTYVGSSSILSGTMTFTRAVEAGDACYMFRDMDLRLTYLGSSTDMVGHDGYWTDEVSVTSDPYRYTGNTVVKADPFGTGVSDYTCAVWKSSTQTQYVYDDTYTLRYDTDYQGLPMVMILTSCDTVSPDVSCTPDVRAEHTLSIEGVSEGSIGDAMEFTAVGDGFGGWYVDGVLTTTDDTLVVDRLTPGVIYEARVAHWSLVVEDPVLSFSEHGFGDVVTVYYGDDPGVVIDDGDVQFLRSGVFRLVEDVEGVDRMMTVLFDETRSFVFSWEFQGVQYTLEPGDLRLSDICALSLDDVTRGDFDDPEAMGEYFTTDDPYIMDIAAKLGAFRGDMDDRTFADFVLRFVQSITYSYDEATRSESEYIKYPVEYVWDRAGDCEDSAIMYAVLMDILGYESGVVVFRDHAMTFLSIEPEDGDELLYDDGVAYILAETTGALVTDDDPDGVLLGDNPLGYRSDDAVYIHHVGGSE